MQNNPSQAAADRARLIMQTVVQMEKQFGKGAVVQLGSRNAMAVSVISSGSISIDAALGVGGLPRGRTRVVGQDHSRAARHRRGAGGRRVRGVH